MPVITIGSGETLPPLPPGATYRVIEIKGRKVKMAIDHREPRDLRGKTERREPED